jgi:sugar phosphate isomerase/epimerase
MYTCLNTGAIGIKNFTLAQSIDLAKQTGFAGVDFNIREAAQLAGEHGIDYVRNLFASAGIKPGSWGAPVEWRKDDETWQRGLDDLPRLAQVAQQLDAPRMTTWVMPNSDTRPFDENYQFHIDRFRPIAEAVKPYGVRFGLEFIGPQTLRPADKHAFVYTMQEMLDLGKAIGTGNIGLLLDAWHLYTSGGTLDDLDTVTNADIVAVHVNNAPEGLTMAEYNCSSWRRLATTGR